MIITLDNVKEKIKTEDLVKLTYLHSSKNQKYWKLIDNLVLELSNKDVIVIEKGFVCDLSSAPKFLWGLFPPFGDFLLAAVIHDYLYINQTKHTYSQKFCDKEMLKWSKVLNTSIWGKIDNYLRYFYVRIFGFLLWKDIIELR